MPKMKTHKGTAKRFRRTGTGKIMHAHAFKSHILTKKTKKQKRNLTHFSLVAGCDKANVLALLARK